MYNIIFSELNLYIFDFFYFYINSCRDRMRLSPLVLTSEMIHFAPSRHTNMRKL
jgi:hypothetical protein